MPFTPIHMGPGILIKALLQGSFSLMVFGWSQIVMDIQPLLVMITGEGHLHGFSHTYIGATILAIFSALSGKYLSEICLYILGMNMESKIKISWIISILSAFIGTFSHVLIDSIIHSDMKPLYPLIENNNLLGLISIEALHKACLYSGIVGGFTYFGLNWLRNKK